MLRHIRNPHVGMLPDRAVVGLQLAGQQLDHRRLARPIGANHSHAGRERALDGDARKDPVVAVGVLKHDVVHFEDGAVFAFDAFEEARLGEFEDEALRGGQLVVGARFRDLFDKLGQVPLVALQLQPLVVDDIRAHIVQKPAVVGDHHAGDLLQIVQIVFQPRNIQHVQMIGRLVQQQNIRVSQHGACKRKLHLPPTREGRDRGGHHLAGEANTGQNPLNFCHCDPLEGLVPRDEINHRKLSSLPVNVVLHVDGSEHVFGGEPVKLAVRNGAHQRRFSGTVGPAKPVAFALLEAQFGVVQQDFSTIREGKFAVAEINAGLVLFLLILAGLDAAALFFRLHKLLADGKKLVCIQKAAQVRVKAELPLLIVKDSRINHLCAKSGNILERFVEQLAFHFNTHQRLHQIPHHTFGIHFLDTQRFGGVNSATSLHQRFVGSGGHIADFWIGNFIADALQAGQKFGEKQGGVFGVVDQLAHIVDNHAGFSLDWRRSFRLGTNQQGHHDG
eukprot:Sdes_comp20633_c0_seq1m15785